MHDVMRARRRTARTALLVLALQVVALIVVPVAHAAAPTISSFSPTSGPVGTSVVITGTGFTGANRVEFNGTAAAFTVTSDTQITATVPTGATDGPISVVNPPEGTGTSASSFDVTPSGVPTITSFSPATGPVGTSVTITGTNFTGASSVKFAGTSATFTVNSATQITASVPAGASTGAITVTTPGGTATSASSFTVTPSPPTITSFSPTSGAVGTSVTINGTGFTGATSVTFNGVSATFTVTSATKITTTVPAGASTGKIRVTTASGTATSSTDFTVTVGAPTISSFSPLTGPVGTSVVLSGAGFTGTITVKFDGTSAAFTVNSSTQITTSVPTGATTGKITVTTANGTGTSATDFIVTAVPTITSFSPSTGPVGSTVTITGTNFAGTSTVAFSGVSATFTIVSGTRISAVVPAGATTGRITVTNSAGSATSADDFIVAPVPVITSFSPTSGRVGTQVTITGSNFTGTTAVTFDGVSATFTVQSATRILAVVPAGAGDGKIRVTTANGTGVSETDFIVQEFHSRTVSLRLARHLVAKGQVSAGGFTACEAGVAVKIQRRKAGTWRTLKFVTTGADGSFRTRLRDRRGRYRAVAVRIVTVSYICRRSVSAVRRHAH